MISARRKVLVIKKLRAVRSARSFIFFFIFYIYELNIIPEYMLVM